MDEAFDFRLGNIGSSHCKGLEFDHSGTFTDRKLVAVAILQTQSIDSDRGWRDFSFSGLPECPLMA